MKTTILILINKLTTKICHLFKRDGSVFPGSIANKYDKTILLRLFFGGKK